MADEQKRAVLAPAVKWKTGDGFLLCPECGRKTKTKVLPETTMKGFPLYCNFCRKQTIIDYQG